MIRAAMMIAVLFFCTAAIAESAVIRAMVRDIDARPVEGVKIFLYESTNVRKPANFISRGAEGY